MKEVEGKFVSVVSVSFDIIVWWILCLVVNNCSVKQYISNYSVFKKNRSSYSCDIFKVNGSLTFSFCTAQFVLQLIT